jgi:hypothetical protein
VGSRSPDGWDQIPRWAGGWACTSHPGVLGSIPKREEPGKTGAPCVKVPGSSRVPVRDGQTSPHRPRLVVSRSTCPPISPPPPCKHLCTRSCSNKHTPPPISPPTPHVNSFVLGPAELNTHTPRPGWAPDPLMVGIRSPDGLVVVSCTSHPGVLGSIPKREEPGKTGAPCIIVPRSSRVPPPHVNSFVLGPAVINTHTVYSITFGSGKQLFPGLTVTGINSVRGALPVEIIDYTLNLRSSRAPGARSAPGETLGLHGFRAHSQG